MVGDEFAVHKEPVGKECTLQSVDCIALYAQVSVVPVLPICTADVSVGNVHAAYISRCSVDDTKLSMVAIVYLIRKKRHSHWQ